MRLKGVTVVEQDNKWLGFIVPSTIAILSGLSVGSGGLLVIWLTEFVGISTSAARGINLMFFVFSALAAFLFHIRRRKLRFGLIAYLAFFALAGTLIGTYIGERIDPSLLKKLFGGFLVLSGIYTLIGSKDGNKSIVTHNKESEKYFLNIL